MGHARRIRPVFDYRITDLEVQIKTNKNKHTDIDTEVNCPKFHTEILKNTSIFQYRNDCLKPLKIEWRGLAIVCCHLCTLEIKLAY